MKKFELCLCGSVATNTGQPNCVPIGERTVGFIFFDKFDSDGNLNKIAAADVLDAAYFTAKINETDKSKRWYPTPKISNIEDVRAEPVTFDVDGISIIVDQGPRTFLGNFYDKVASPQWVAVLNSRQCIDTAYFEVTASGQLRGIIDGAGDMVGIAIETGTLNAIYVKKTKTTPQGAVLTFAVNELVRDEDLVFIASGDIGVDVKSLRGLLDVVGSNATATTTTDAELDLEFCYGSLRDLSKFKGGVLADFSADGGTTPNTIYNVTAAANVVLSAVVESPDGHYTLTYPAQTLNDVLRVQIVKDGYEMEPITFTAL